MGQISEENDSLERDEDDDEYSEDFYQSSIRNKNASIKSKKSSRLDVEESAAYTETVEDASGTGIDEEIHDVSDNLDESR
jgi:hypothetical protein